jgi:DNA-directed RNA polymerase subunit F
LKVLDKKEITIAEAGQYYSRVAVTTNYEDAIVQEYLNKFSKLPAEKARELVSELVSKGVSVATAVSIANCLPSSRDELLPFLAHEQAISPLEKLGELFSVVEKYLPDKQVPVKGRYEGDGD